MSGIFAYAGNEPAKDILLNGIAHLRKRGEDMTGIALKNEDSLSCIKTKGSPDDLRAKAKATESESTLGIAECLKEGRCKASPITAAPSSNNLYAAALDGSIENFDSLKSWTKEPFPIATEEDLLLACLCIINTSNKIAMINKLSDSFLGNPSFAFISSGENAVYCRSGQSKLLVGTAPNGVYLASELNALIPFCEKYTILESGESARLSADRILVYDIKQKKIKKTFLPVPEQSYFENDYILSDEIYYCPLAAKETFNHFVKSSGINFDYLRLTHRNLDRINKIIIVGANSSKNTAFIAKHIFELLCGVTAIAQEAFEFKSSNTPVDKNTLLIAVSHRGETQSTIDCVRKAKAYSAKTIGITSNPSSALSRECEFFINPNCDFDSSSVSLRSFISGYLALCFFALYLGKKLNIVTELYLGVALKMAEMLSGKISSAIKNTPLLEEASQMLLYSKNVFLAGVGADFALSLEGAEKIREITKKNASAVYLSELSDYPGELLSSSTVFAFITNKELLQKALSYIRQIKTKGAKVIILTTESIEEEISDFEKIISFNDSLPIFNPLPCIASIYKIAVLASEAEENLNMEQSA